MRAVMQEWRSRHILAIGLIDASTGPMTLNSVLRVIRTSLLSKGIRHEHLDESHGSSTCIWALGERYCYVCSPSIGSNQVVHHCSGSKAPHSYELLDHHRKGRLQPDVVGKPTSRWSKQNSIVVWAQRHASVSQHARHDWHTGVDTRSIQNRQFAKVVVHA